MHATAQPHTNATTRELLRELRFQSTRQADPATSLPESNLWQIYCVVRNRGEARADGVFLGALKSLHRRRSEGACTLPVTDTDPHEHKMVDDPMLAELWRAYKRCICAKRVGPASQLLSDIEGQLQAS
jgi:hypothetical protein